MTEKELAQEIARKYGTVKRCRGPFLYTQKGERLTDLFQEKGRSILGWGKEGSSAFTILKNVLDRGITGSFETDFGFCSSKKCPSRLSKSCSELFASPRNAFIFNSKEKALKAALLLSKENTGVFRPWNCSEIDWRQTDCIIFAPPLPWYENHWILAASTNIAGNPQELNSNLSAIKIPAPLEAAYTRSIYDLIKALQEREEKHWFIYDKVLTKYFTRKGPYLYPKVPEEKYNDFVIHCLNQKIIISPDYTNPSIVPFKADKGVFSSLQKNPFVF